MKIDKESLFRELIMNCPFGGDDKKIRYLIENYHFTDEELQEAITALKNGACSASEAGQAMATVAFIENYLQERRTA